MNTSTLPKCISSFLKFFFKGTQGSAKWQINDEMKSIISQKETLKDFFLIKYLTSLFTIMQHSANLSHSRGLLLNTCTASTRQSNAGIAFPQCSSWMPMLYNNSKCRLIPIEFSVLPDKFLSEREKMCYELNNF